MCGITGVASRRPVQERGIVSMGCDALRHRGPDDAGEWWSPDSRVGLGHRRLAIIDLTSAGHQPMLDASRELALSFNGEIYNYRELREELQRAGRTFNTGTDTETILHAYRAWGVDCLSRLNGMFAFALYDSRSRTLFMARDRAGEKPLFYAMNDGELRFASELKALLAHPSFPRRIDRDALDCYLAMGYVPGERCILEGVRKLPPAHALQFDLETGVLRTWRYWQPPAPPERPRPDAELVDMLEGLLADAVRQQLVADVPVGILLSGGVDSSLVTAMAARVASDVKTFTVAFPGHASHDEAEHARLIARHFGTDHTELQGGDATPDVLRALARQYDEPIADPSMVPTFLVTRLIREHCTVALGGDGGDELFGGYHSHSRMVWLDERLGRVPRVLRLPVARIAERLLPPGYRGSNFLQSVGVDFAADVPAFSEQFMPSGRDALMRGQAWRTTAEGIRRSRMPRIADALQRVTRLDFENYMPEDILVKVDRASMLNSLEVRAPFLDYRVVEFAFGEVPSGAKASASERKLLLKQLCARVLPPEFDRRRKQGFSMPLERWLQRGPWRTFFEDVLLSSDAGLFDRAFVTKLFRGIDLGRPNGDRLFALTIFELWRREYRATL